MKVAQGRQPFWVVALTLLVVACASRSDEGVGSNASALIVPQPDAEPQPDAGPNPPGPSRDAAADVANGPSLPPAALAADPPSFQQSAAPGSGILIGVGDASPWLVGTGWNNIFHYNNDSAPPRAWSLIDTSSYNKGIAVSPEGTPWKIDSSHLIWERTSQGTWVQKGTLTAYEVSVGVNENAWAISTTCSPDCVIYHWSGTSWGTMGSLQGQHIAVSPEGNVYMSTSTGSLYKWYGGGWQSFGTTGTCVQYVNNGGSLGVPVIGAGPNDSVWVLGCGTKGTNQPIFAWLARIGQWQQISGAAYTISVGADGTPWVINGQTAYIYEYVSTWSQVGPTGFTLVDTGAKWSGEIHDIAVPTGGGFVVAGATSGGVWESAPSLLSWFEIGDVPGGVTSQGQQPSGPNMSIGTVAIKPSDSNTVVVGTGVGDGIVNNATNRIGNGIYYTRNATGNPVTWTEAYCDNQRCQSPTFKIRYFADHLTILASANSRLYYANDMGGGLAFTHAGCQPGQITDLVTDLSNSAAAYMAVPGVGVYRTGDWGNSCAPSVPGGTASNLAYLALAAASSGLVYASAVDPNGNFLGIFSTTSSTFPAWTTVVPAQSLWGMCPQCGHNWALATDSTGATILAGGVGLWRFSGCSAGGCTGQSVRVDDPQITAHAHGDYHAIVWPPGGNIVYVANDGGLFSSLDGGSTWGDGINTLGVANEYSVSVNGATIFASAWDVGVNYSINGGGWQGDG